MPAPIGHQDPSCRTLSPQYPSPKPSVKPSPGEWVQPPVPAIPCHSHCPLSQFRLVVKMALKLLLVFVEYTEPNALLLIRAVNAVDQARGGCSPSPQSWISAWGWLDAEGVGCPCPVPAIECDSYGMRQSWPMGAHQEPSSGDEEGVRCSGCSAPYPKSAVPWCHLPALLVPGACPWSNLMAILEQRNGADTELLVFAMTLINKVSIRTVPWDHRVPMSPVPALSLRHHPDAGRPPRPRLLLRRDGLPGAAGHGEGRAAIFKQQRH